MYCMYILYALTTLHSKFRLNLKKGNGNMNNTFLLFTFGSEKKKQTNKTKLPSSTPTPQKRNTQKGILNYVCKKM